MSISRRNNDKEGLTVNEFDLLRSVRESRDKKGFDYQERRKKSDWIVKMATILCVIAWVFVLAFWFVLEAARPERAMEFINSLLRVHFDSPTYARQHWDATLLQPAFILLLVALVICIAALIFNKMRMRRKTDKYRKSIFIIGGITIIGIVAFLIRFGLPF